MTARSRLRRLAISISAGLAVVAGALVPLTLDTTPAAAVSGSQFEDGYIVSDRNFFDDAAMGAGEVQSFLQARVPRCAGGNGPPCLRDYSTTTSAIAGDAFCTGMPGGNMTAAQIVVAAAKACRISPKVLLVMLEKEQGLVTSTSPTAEKYQAALGQSCPDTAPCDSAYSGFYRQVYFGARQMRMYVDRPQWYSYQLGWNNILYNPDAGCGTKSVYIKNDATRALYIYTPYTPNRAALDNLYGTGDRCSAYGNRNFWRLWWDWFGSPTDASPIGSFDSAAPASGGIRITGWALDYDTSDPLIIHTYIDGAFAAGFGAERPRTDVDAVYHRGSGYGFDTVVPATQTGSHRVCVYALNVGSGSNTELGCRIVQMFSGRPIGNLDYALPQPGGIAVGGWTIDTDTTDPVSVHLYLDGRMVGGYRADQVRTDVGSAYPGFGDKHGYTTTITARSGEHRLCSYAINVGGGGGNTELGCTDVTVGGPPIGGALTGSWGPQQITVSGWSIDPDGTAPTWVHVYSDGVFAASVYADQQRSDLGVLAAFGTQHGYSATFAAQSGWHDVCIYGINVQGGANGELGCIRVQVGDSPKGRISNGQPGYASVGVWGWAYDPDVAGPAEVHIYMDDAMVWGGSASISTSDVTLQAAYGQSHGFAARFYARPGSHRVCAYALNIGVGSNAELGCFTTTVAVTEPIGSLDEALADGGGVRVRGWVVDGDTRDPLWFHIYVDGRFAGSGRTDGVRPDVTALYPGFTSPGFSTRIDTSSGQHTVCVYGLNTGGGSVNTEIGCRTVAVP